jgi:hypothetical protein
MVLLRTSRRRQISGLTPRNNDAKLVDHGLGTRKWLRHFAIMASVAISPVAPPLLLFTLRLMDMEFLDITHTVSYEPHHHASLKPRLLPRDHTLTCPQ